MKASLAILLASFLSILCVTSVVSADVSPGDVIDKTNWQKVEGLLPESILNWVKNGDFILKIGELNYNIRDYLQPVVQKNLKSNAGKYDLNEKDVLIEVATGKLPRYVHGIPFPDVDFNTPKAAQKLMYNKMYLILSFGNGVFPLRTKWVGSRGFEREVENVFISVPMDSYEGGESAPNPDNIERYSLVKVLAPFDLDGFAQLLWRFRDERPDINMAYVPAVRRVRRLSPANRSDAFLGSDFCIDDTWGYDGKINLMQWKVLGKQEALLPYSSPNPERIVQNEQGEWLSVPEVTPHVYGYETEGWKGAPWAPVNFIWVKRTVWLIEAVAKDPYYNYGRQIIWCDPEAYNPCIKVIYDRAGNYWKTSYNQLYVSESADRKVRVMQLAIQNMVDDRLRHAGITECASKRNIWVYFAKVDMNDFTVAGFQKYCK